MVSYWSHQEKMDVGLAILLTATAWIAPKVGSPVFFTLTSDSVSAGARSWVGPTLTLLGMTSATTAFIFSVIDRGEFAALKRHGAEGQLWRIFAENIFWLAIAAISSVLVSFLRQPIPQVMYYYVSFLAVVTLICIAKFAWVIRQIIAVRVVRA